MVDPGNLAIVREIENVVCWATSTRRGTQACPANYTLAPGANGSIIVTDSTGVDGIDTLYNIEQIVFCDVPGATRGTCDQPRRQSSSLRRRGIAGTSGLRQSDRRHHAGDSGDHGQQPGTCSSTVSAVQCDRRQPSSFARSTDAFTISHRLVPARSP